MHFEEGITCIVGPNGSGKSNVVDALAWVMGEQGAKSLRGGKMEDVIFAGTSSRPPLGRAEVLLTIDNADGALPIEYAEVTISRTMFRNGGSDYAINGQSCRLLDVQELLSDSGIGREMHVIVGQGQLDALLRATPEERRGFVEEAAGVLKHRKRKEKAVRKLDATDANLVRLGDLLSEIRRQLKPLGRQAEVARRASLVQVGGARCAGSAAGRRCGLHALRRWSKSSPMRALCETAARQRQHLWSTPEPARQTSKRRFGRDAPQLDQAQETSFALAGLRERFRGMSSVADERVRNVSDDAPDERHGRNPDELQREAADVRAREQQIQAEVVRHQRSLDQAEAARQRRESAHQQEEQRVAALVRAAADRREGLARLAGQVESAQSRVAAADDEMGRLRRARLEAATRAERAQQDFTSLETKIAGLDAGEHGLDAEHEGATSLLVDINSRLAKLHDEARSADRERAALVARKEALELGLSRKDGTGALLAEFDSVAGVLGSVAALVTVRSGYEAALASALGPAANAAAVRDLGTALEAIRHLKAHELGQAALMLAGKSALDEVLPDLGPTGTYAVDVVEAPDELRGALRRVLHKTVVVDDLTSGRELVERFPDMVAVTRDGDLLGTHFAAGDLPRSQA
ncbi:MAG: AAA family ATPase [Nocardioidaceae bacterium]